MPDADFSDALGRLLTDGALRERFAADPEAAIASFCEDALLRAQLVTLKFEELEVQAEILIRKRFDVTRRLIPQLIARRGAKAWPLFRQYAHACWRPAPEDALEFAHYAQADQGEIREINRLRFALRESGRLKLHWIREEGALPALQVLVRLRRGKWREFVFSLRF